MWQHDSLAWLIAACHGSMLWHVALHEPSSYFQAIGLL